MLFPHAFHRYSLLYKIGVAVNNAVRRLLWGKISIILINNVYYKTAFT